MQVNIGKVSSKEATKKVAQVDLQKLATDMRAARYIPE